MFVHFGQQGRESYCLESKSRRDQRQSNGIRKRLRFPSWRIRKLHCIDCEKQRLPDSMSARSCQGMDGNYSDTQGRWMPPFVLRCQTFLPHGGHNLNSHSRCGLAGVGINCERRAHGLDCHEPRHAKSLFMYASVSPYYFAFRASISVRCLSISD